MTGAYVRIQRDDKWQVVEIDQLTDDELDKWFQDRPDDAEKWAKFLAKWIRHNVVAGEDS